jgi:hypothetical protein
VAAEAVMAKPSATLATRLVKPDNLRRNCMGASLSIEGVRHLGSAWELVGSTRASASGKCSSKP